MVMPYHLYMPSYFLETFTEYPSLLEETSSQKSCGILKFHIYFFPFIKHCLFTSIRHSNCKLPLIQHPFIAATACINSQCPLGIIPSHRNFSISTVFVIIVIAFILIKHKITIGTRINTNLEIVPFLLGHVLHIGT